ncbi:hypothetical protein CTA1_12416 [Colletotrichum tanaceti]|uniref:C2H2-type domain-containing protein n=1 Tax=Colletotrichum tanaceti TaxID=1306861 RepID=A0A4U6X9V7_9PEZI|nr:hypothetical protein CTA1_12416 [Colletotrichum tanaceti]
MQAAVPNAQEHNEWGEPWGTWSDHYAAEARSDEGDLDRLFWSTLHEHSGTFTFDLDAYTEQSSSLFGHVCWLDAFTTPHRPVGDSELGSSNGSDLAFVSEAYFGQPPETLYTASETCDEVENILDNELFRVPELTLPVSSATSPLSSDPTLRAAAPPSLVDGCLDTETPPPPSLTSSHEVAKKPLPCQRGCPLSFASPKDLRRHYGSEKHARGREVKAYRCRCGYSTPRKDHYRRHLRGIAESRPCRFRRPFFECICRREETQGDAGMHLRHIDACRERARGLWEAEEGSGVRGLEFLMGHDGGWRV